MPSIVVDEYTVNRTAGDVIEAWMQTCGGTEQEGVRYAVNVARAIVTRHAIENEEMPEAERKLHIYMLSRLTASIYKGYLSTTSGGVSEGLDFSCRLAREIYELNKGQRVVEEVDDGTGDTAAVV